jgi:hypothetical protein
MVSHLDSLSQRMPRKMNVRRVCDEDCMNRERFRPGTQKGGQVLGSPSFEESIHAKLPFRIHAD